MTMIAAAMATMATVEAATITRPFYPCVFGVETMPRAVEPVLGQERGLRGGSGFAGRS